MNPKIITIRGKKYVRFEILSLDVWGNAREGFWLNDVHHSGVFVTLPEEFTDKDIILALKRAGEMKRGIHHKSVRIEMAGDDLIEIFDARNDKLEYQLQVPHDDNEGTP